MESSPEVFLVREHIQQTGVDAFIDVHGDEGLPYVFVSGGENIFPGEVEALLLRHPAVHQALVMPFDHELKGQVPYAFVVIKDGAELTEDDLKQFALANGPAYQHPRRVIFLDQFPLAGTNKVDRERLRKRAAEGAAK